MKIRGEAGQVYRVHTLADVDLLLAVLAQRAATAACPRLQWVLHSDIDLLLDARNEIVRRRTTS